MLFAVNISAGEDCLQNSAACRFAGLADDFEQCLSTHTITGNMFWPQTGIDMLLL